MKQDNDNVIYFDRKDGCGFCHVEVKKLFKTFDSKEACLVCGAIYNSYESTTEMPGSFTGNYEPVDKANLNLDQQRIKEPKND